jgi:L-alanine-DL-glutamate epimerase-like enolase superfamily enzyme
MASTNVGAQEMPRRPGSSDNKLFPRQIEWEDGYSWCPDVPGLGVDFDIDEAEGAYVNPTGMGLQLRRPDGAKTNW